MASQAKGPGGGDISSGVHAAPQGLPSQGGLPPGQEGAALAQVPFPSQKPGIAHAGSQRIPHGSTLHGVPQGSP
jgi:hypothetical protein